MSMPIAGKTLGILGTGAVGQELAKKAAALKMSVIGTKNTPEPLAGVDQVFAPDEVDAVLSRSDFVVLLLPAGTRPGRCYFANVNCFFAALSGASQIRIECPALTNFLQPRVTVAA